MRALRVGAMMDFKVMSIGRLSDLCPSMRLLFFYILVSTGGEDYLIYPRVSAP
jgi:hypothetical protein